MKRACSPIIRLMAVCYMVPVLIFSSCKKKEFDKNTENTGNPGNGQVTDISGTSWKHMDSTFIANKYVMAMMTFQNKLVVTYLSSTNGGPPITSGHLSQNTIVPHSFGYLMSGIGFRELAVVDNDLYALGAFDHYGSFKMNPGYLSTMTSLAWNTYWSSYTNQYGITKAGDEIIGSFAASPYVRSKGSTTFPDVERNTGNPIVNEVIYYNGELICAGAFDSYNGTTLNNIARWNGSSWEPLGPGLDGQINDLAIVNGDLVAAGNFTQSGDASVTCRFVARWNGSSWSSLGDQLIGGYAGALTLSVYGDQLFVGGDFNGTATVYSPYVLKWKNGNWQSLAGGAPLPVDEIAVCDGHLYVVNANYTSGGNFLLRLD